MAESSRVQVYPEPTVGGLIVNGEGKILLTRSHKWFGKYTLPGGHIELGETAEEAVRREVKEEVSLDVEVGRLLLMQEAIYTSEFWKKRHYVFLDYLCRAKDQPVKIDQDEIQDYTWAYPGAALSMDLDSFTKKTVSKYLEGK